MYQITTLYVLNSYNVIFAYISVKLEKEEKGKIFLSGTQ